MRAAHGMAALAVTMMLSGCVMFYTDYPDIQARATPQAAPGKSLQYRYNKLPLFAGGKDPLGKVFTRDAGFSKAKRIRDKDKPVPGKGTFVDITLSWKEASVPAAVSSYVSLATLTFWPTISTKDGYRVEYVLYTGGKKRGTYQYEITRKAGIWLPLALVSWINLIRPGEVAAFSATARQFVADARKDGLI